MIKSSSVFSLVMLALTLIASPSEAQTASPWSADVSIGWDAPISGDFLQGGVGTLRNTAVVIEDSSWGDVYGTGVLFNIGVGYAFSERDELRASFTHQRTGSNELISVGRLGAAELFATFESYNAWAFDAGYRRYFGETARRWRPYAGGSLGVGSVGNIDADLAAPSTNFVLNETEFYEGNAALTFGLNGGVLYSITERIGIDVRLGFRHVGGLGNVVGAELTGLDDVNEGSSRWTVPFTVGAKFRF